MFINTKVAKRQQQNIQYHAQNSDALSFFNQLTSPELLEILEAQLPEHRERLYPPTETLSMFLAQTLSEDRSCKKAVNDAVVSRVLSGLPLVSSRTGGYCRARQRLPLKMITTLVQCTSELMDNQTPEQWLWRGRRVRLIDGTTVSMPDTEENQSAYPQQQVQKPELGFPICRLVGIVCLSSGAVINASIGKYSGKGSSEQTLLRNMLDTFDAGDMVLGDAFYGTYFLLAALLNKGVDALFEQMGARKRVTDFRKGKRLGTRDHVVQLTKPVIKPSWMTQEHYNNAPDTLKIRELKVGGKLLISTLLCPKQTPKNEIEILYKRRWEIEVDFRNIKTTMGMKILSCKSPKMIEKEIWATFLAYNLIRLLMAQAAVTACILPRQISFKHTVQLWLAWSQQVTLSKHNADIGVLFVLIAQQQVGKRTGRIEPRAVKRRPDKAYPMLMKSRAQARADVREKGHPKKLK
jgi:hypothetical protein